MAEGCHSKIVAMTNPIATSRLDIRVITSNTTSYLANNGEVFPRDVAQGDRRSRLGELMAHAGIDAQHARNTAVTRHDQMADATPIPRPQQKLVEFASRQHDKRVGLRHSFGAFHRKKMLAYDRRGTGWPRRINWRV